MLAIIAVMLRSMRLEIDDALLNDLLRLTAEVALKLYALGAVIV